MKLLRGSWEALGGPLGGFWEALGSLLGLLGGLLAPPGSLLGGLETSDGVILVILRLLGGSRSLLERSWGLLESSRKARVRILGSSWEQKIDFKG